MFSTVFDHVNLRKGSSTTNMPSKYGPGRDYNDGAEQRIISLRFLLYQ